MDVEIEWELEICTPYVKSINWFVIGECLEPPEEACVLFDTWFEFSGVYVFELVAGAEVELLDDEDVDPDNNYAESPPLYLIVNVGLM